MREKELGTLEQLNVTPLRRWSAALDRRTFAVNAPGLTQYADKGISSIKPPTLI